jgi:HSP20 family protein
MSEFWEEDEQDPLAEMERRIRWVLDETLTGIESTLFDVEAKCLKPLYRIEATDDEVVVTLDLPCVNKEDVVVSSTEDSLNIEAKMRRPVSLRIGGSSQREEEFERYSKSIRLPARVDPSRARATFRSGILTVRLPILRRGKTVRIH